MAETGGFKRVVYLDICLRSVHDKKLFRFGACKRNHVNVGAFIFGLNGSYLKARSERGRSADDGEGDVIELGFVKLFLVYFFFFQL